MLRALIELATSYHMLSPARVAVLRNLNKVRLENGWESFVRGDEATLPYWMATALSSEGYVDLREQKLTDSDVGKYLLVEKGLKSNEFTSLKERFYLEARQLMNSLKNSPIRGSEDLAKLIKLEGNLSDLLRIRLRKIVQIAFLGGKPEEYVDRLLPEERALFVLVREMIASWSEEVLSLGEP